MAKINIEKKIDLKKEFKVVSDYEKGNEESDISPHRLKVARSKLMTDILDESNKYIEKNGEKGFTVKSIINATLVRNMASLGLTNKVIAQMFGISDRQFRYILKEKPELSEALNMGRSLVSMNFIEIAQEKILSGDDKNNGLLKMFLQSFAGLEETKVNRIEDNRSEDEETISKEELKKELLEAMREKAVNVINGEFEEVKEVKQIEDK